MIKVITKYLNSSTVFHDLPLLHQALNFVFKKTHHVWKPKLIQKKIYCRYFRFHFGYFQKIKTKYIQNDLQLKTLQKFAIQFFLLFFVVFIQFNNKSRWRIKNLSKLKLKVLSNLSTLRKKWVRPLKFAINQGVFKNEQ